MGALSVLMTSNWSMVNANPSTVLPSTTFSMKLLVLLAPDDAMTIVSVTAPEDAPPINTAVNVSTWSMSSQPSMLSATAHPVISLAELATVPQTKIVLAAMMASFLSTVLASLAIPAVSPAKILQLTVVLSVHSATICKLTAPAKSTLIATSCVSLATALNPTNAHHARKAEPLLTVNAFSAV